MGVRDGQKRENHQRKRRDLKHLGGLESLLELKLNYTAISDQGLDHLLRLPRLESLELRGTRVTAEGVEQWQKRYEEKAGRRCSLLAPLRFFQRSPPDDEADAGPPSVRPEASLDEQAGSQSADPAD